MPCRTSPTPATPSLSRCAACSPLRVLIPPSLAKFNARRGCRKAWWDRDAAIVSIAGQPLHAELPGRIGPDTGDPQARARCDAGEAVQRVLATQLDQHRLACAEMERATIDVHVLLAPADDVG